ncbi:MAG: hypothetical protein JWO36_2465 [Myxococcales bacterium]|nr:hypothetical protein [Myxococcales bacterium]
MAMITTKDGTRIYDKDSGQGPPIVFSDAWPALANAWDEPLTLKDKSNADLLAFLRG